uniref:Uncharacterized protein n=1 Tax=Streptomyces sp. NBC_01393 TaxID=2903851 RepID=A0AAU3I9A8_9ACTN
MRADDEWAQMLGSAAAVICPYDTRIQCVSGVIAEALSVGTPVLATDFPFAREMQHLYPDYVAVENDLREWPKLTRQFTRKSLSVPGYPNWPMFTKSLLEELSTLRTDVALPVSSG